MIITMNNDVQTDLIKIPVTFEIIGVVVNGIR